MAVPRIKRVPARAIYCDIDNTLIHWPMDEYYQKNKSFTVDLMGSTLEVSPNDSNIELLKGFFKRGYEVILWSNTGKEWTQQIAKALNITDYVDYYLSKPDFLIDDLRLDQFLSAEQILWKKPSGF